MFQTIFGDTIKGLTIEHVAFHFMEEVGEVATAVRRLYEEAGKFQSEMKKLDSIETAVKAYTQSADNQELREVINLKLSLAVEIADSYSWWSAIYIKAEQIFKESQSSLIRGENTNFIFQRVYKTRRGKLVCPNCNNTKCVCQFFFEGVDNQK